MTLSITHNAVCRILSATPDLFTYERVQPVGLISLSCNWVIFNNEKDKTDFLKGPDMVTQTNLKDGLDTALREGPASRPHFTLL